MTVDDFVKGEYCYVLNLDEGHTKFTKPTYIMHDINSSNNYTVRLVNHDLLDGYTSNDTLVFEPRSLTPHPYLPEHLINYNFDISKTLENLDKLEKKWEDTQN